MNQLQPVRSVPLRLPALLLLLLVLGLARAQQGGLETTQISIGEHRLQVELALTPRQRQLGLMYRRSLAEDSGMLFVFSRPQPLSFWMKNTLIPLDIAYLDAEGRILDILQMQPLSLDGHASSAPARFALEVNQGWFAARGIRVGAQVELPSRLLRRD